jgi:UMF1 family MFS transporter
VVVGLLAVVKLDADYLVTGAVLISLAVVTSELAGVFVNSVLPEISTPAHRGRVSGTAWAVGYWGSILCLGLVLVLFVMPGTGLLGITADAGWNFRAIALFVAAWILVGTLPLMLWAPRPGRGGTGAVGVSGAAAAACRAAGTGAPRERWTPWQGYAQIARRIVRTFREDPRTLAFLVASAIYRDGLGTVFAVAGVLAANAYGFSTVEVIIFGIAANLVAGFGVFVGGFVDDRVGSRAVIIGGCTAILAFGTVMLLFDSTAVFWAVGLVVCAFVGPVQSASRNLLTRLSKPGRETENFGLYATTGRALGFLGTSLFSLCVWLFSDTRMGILGILVVMAVGLAAFVPIKLGEAGRPAQDVETGAGAGTRADEGGSPRG